MGKYVHIHVCFACNVNDGVAELAKKHRLNIDDECQEAGVFLDALSERKGRNPGPKGGLSMWGMIGNKTNEDKFVEVLKPFWEDLLLGVEDGPRQFEHILVFVEHEQAELTIAIEIYLAREENPGALTVKKHECSFAWMQF